MSTTFNKRQLASGISVIAIAAALGVATPAYAQAEYGTIQGHVDGAAVGTQVIAVDTNTGQRGVGTVNQQGDYEIIGLRPSTYNVTVAGKAAQTAQVGVGQAITVDFAAARAAGGIVVTGRRTAQPVQTQTVATNITTAQIENLPQNTRNFLSFAALAPGVQLVSPSGSQQLQAGALSPSNANILIDGMSFKNPINHGGALGQNFGIGNPFPQVAIQEYQVQTQNFGAETGQAASALLTAITKTGGNEFHGSAFVEYQPKGFIEQPHFDKLRHVPKPDYKRWQFGGDLGGPIIPGKLTFYVAGEGTSESLPSVTGSVQGIPSSLASQINISHAKTFKQGLYFGKLTWFATPDDTVNLEGFIRRENNLADIDSNATSSHARTLLTHQNRYQLQWKHSAGNFLNFVNIAYDKATQSTPTLGSGPEFNLSQPFSSQAVCLANTPPAFQATNCGATVGTSGGYLNPDFSVRAATGSHFFTQGDIQKAWIVKDDATLRHGAHTFKAGAQVTFYDLSRTVNNAFNGRYYYFNPGPTGTFDPNTNIPYGAQINLQPSQAISGKDTQVGLYVQDEWKPDIHWTINAGLRWDFESNPNDKDYVTPPDIAAALRAYPGWAARGINPEDYISNGHNRHPVWDEFQPRLGISYDVHGDRDLVLFGGAGRYYDRPLFIEGVIESLTNSSKIQNVTFCQAFAGRPGGPPANCVNFTPALLDPNNLRPIAAALASGQGGPVWVLPNKTKMPYSDQFDIGVRKRFGSIQTSLTYAHIESRNLFMFVRANFFANGWYTRFPVTNSAGAIIGCTNGGDQFISDYNSPPANFPNCPAVNGQLTGRSGRLDRGENDGKARLDALYLQIEKPFTDQSIWGFTEAVTLQRARSTIAFNLFEDESWNEPGFGTYGWNNVAGVPKWQSVTSANWRAPYGFILSGTLTLTSGPSFGHINCNVPIPPDAGCYANLGGVYWPKQDIGYKRLDLRIAKTFKMPWGHELTADFEAFNVFNWLNRSYSEWGAGGGANPPRTEDSELSNNARQFQAGLHYKF
ncbi:TonB-dependent receptor domain-containing protein [Sphingomonas sp.]|uniref:TonB-dependent receptor n=1 Tax=Sphingomonas sp. TaxID=28214 RepID=UPI0038A1650A